MRRHVFLLLAPIALLAPTAAHAADGTVETDMTAVAHPSGDQGYFLLAECEARALGANATTIAIETTVTCSIGDITSTRSTYGPTSATAVLTPSEGSQTFCISARAVLVDVRDATSKTVVAAPRCWQFPPTGS